MTKALREREGERGRLSDPSFIPLPPLGARYAEFVVDGEGKEWNAADDDDRERGEGRKEQRMLWGGTTRAEGRFTSFGTRVVYLPDWLTD